MPSAITSTSKVGQAQGFVPKSVPVIEAILTGDDEEAVSLKAEFFKGCTQRKYLNGRVQSLEQYIEHQIKFRCLDVAEAEKARQALKTFLRA
jgi:hypothetical protein